MPDCQLFPAQVLSNKVWSGNKIMKVWNCLKYMEVKPLRDNLAGTQENNIFVRLVDLIHYSIFLFSFGKWKTTWIGSYLKNGKKMFYSHFYFCMLSATILYIYINQFNVVNRTKYIDQLRWPIVFRTRYIHNLTQ